MVSSSRGLTGASGTRGEGVPRHFLCLPCSASRTVPASCMCVPTAAQVHGVVLPGIFPWLDIGSWDALRKVF